MKFNHYLIMGLTEDASHNSETASLLNNKAQRLAEIIVENEILDGKTKIREHAGLEIADIIMICREEVKNEKVNRKFRYLEVLKKELGKCDIEELDEKKYDEEENAMESG